MDMEKVIKGLTRLSTLGVPDCDEGSCPFWRVCVDGEGCYFDMFSSALSLLKEQEWHILTEDADGIVHGLPGDDWQYLMTDGKDIWIDDYVDGVSDGVWLDSGRDIREIKAWMYMPELPKKDRR